MEPMLSYFHRKKRLRSPQHGNGSGQWSKQRKMGRHIREHASKTDGGSLRLRSSRTESKCGRRGEKLVQSKDLCSYLVRGYRALPILNPQLQEELSFTTGQIINVYGEMDDDGFYLGEIDGVRGLVPSNFLAEATDQYPQGQPQPQGQGSMGRGQRGRGHGPGARGPPPPPRDGAMRQRKTGIGKE